MNDSYPISLKYREVTVDNNCIPQFDLFTKSDNILQAISKN